MGLAFNHMNAVQISGTTDATPGTRSSHAHGLGRTPALRNIFYNTIGGAADADDGTSMCLVSADATNVVVKSKQASVAFNMTIFFDTNITNPAASI